MLSLVHMCGDGDGGEGQEKENDLVVGLTSSLSAVILKSPLGGNCFCPPTTF